MPAAKGSARTPLGPIVFTAADRLPYCQANKACMLLCLFTRVQPEPDYLAGHRNGTGMFEEYVLVQTEILIFQWHIAMLFGLKTMLHRSQNSNLEKICINY